MDRMSQSQNEFFLSEPYSNRTVSTIKPNTSYSAKEKNQAWEDITPKKSTQGFLCSWTMALVIIGIIHGIILIVAVIVIPIYVVRYFAAGTSTTSSTVATTTIYMPPQCSNYTLDTDSTRSTTYSIGTTGCDVTLYSTATWVRFGGPATQMASSAPPIYRCATSATGWYTGTLPTPVGSTSTGVVCFSWTSSICDFHSTISVTYCNGFYVYLLVAPSQCALRYCTQ